MRLNSTRKWAVVIAAALVLTFVLSSVAFAGGTTDGNNDDGIICIDGYVINHREVPVDGTKWDPQMEVVLTGEAGEMVATVDENGYFKFEDVAEGPYELKLQLPEDWDSLIPQAERGGTAVLPMTEFPDDKDGCHRVVFKIRRLFDITAIKWEELLDGTVQPGGDWEITFTPQGDPFVKAQTKKTNGSGGAVFTVTPGSWLIHETVKPGWTPVTPPQVHLMLDQYEAPGAKDPVVFKNREPICHGEIIVEKTGLGRDANGGLVWLGPLAGWNITLSRYDGTMYPVTKMTDASGRVTFSDLRPGVYKVDEHLQYGWKAISDNPQTVVVRGCDEPYRVLFENEEISGELTIKGKKIYRVWTGPAGGLGLAGWVITATLKGTDYAITTTTDALGNYQFSAADLAAAGIGFPGATVEVCEESRDNWIHVSPKCVYVTFPYPVPADYKGATVNFTNIQDPPLPGTAGASMGTACSVSYQVVPGDNLYGIAARFGTSVNAIAQASGLSNINLIRAGQTLCVQ